MANNIAVRDSNGASLSMASIDNDGVHTPVSQVSSIQKKFRDSFGQALATNWDVTVSGGTTATVADGVLTIASGTTAGGYAELLGKETFSVPFRVMAGVQTGTPRQANTHHRIEAVSVDPVTGIPDGKSSMAIAIGGASTMTVTQMIYEVQNSGLRPLLSSAATIVTTTTYSLLEIEPFSDETYFHSRVIDSATSRANSYVRQQQVPDPNAVYKLRIRSHNMAAWKNITGAISGTAGVVRLTCTAHGYTTSSTVWVEALNGITGVRGNYVITVVDANTFELNGTVFSGDYTSSSGRCALAAAPANINLQLQFVSCTDYAELTAEITSGRGQSVAGQGLGVNVIGTVPVSGTVTATTTSQDNVFFNESVTAQAASAVVTGAVRDVGVVAGAAHRYNKFRVFAYADVAGTIRIECSNDNVTWRLACVNVAVSANIPATSEAFVLTRYYRAYYINGATLQTVFMLNTAYTAG
jgi:hypothetical protein